MKIKGKSMLTGGVFLLILDAVIFIGILFFGFGADMWGIGGAQRMVLRLMIFALVAGLVMIFVGAVLSVVQRGRPLEQEQEVICAKCLAPVPREDTFCQKCGAAIESGKTAIKPKKLD